ncbi:MAG TPA: hypothetical protein PLR20_13845 [Syntrophales bacterium]|nr:hypothetical protein [Syntrophales bacterium]HPN26182.1 hypothetical protein [Syntrophales bacterium]HQM30427.1 hypothetical protein [Syntrophales bacterium]
MIFAEIEYQEPYEKLHNELVSYIGTLFSRVQSGLQGDSWIWVFDGEEKVAIDTFTSMKHQIKSPKAGPHVQKVIDALILKYRLRVYEEPEFEGHEDEST